MSDILEIAHYLNEMNDNHYIIVFHSDAVHDLFWNAGNGRYSHHLLSATTYNEDTGFNAAEETPYFKQYQVRHYRHLTNLRVSNNAFDQLATLHG